MSVSSGANRWMTRQLWRCGKCTVVVPLTEGYRPIDSPFLYNAKQQDLDFFSQQHRAVGDRGYLMKHCTECSAVHGDWTMLDFQSAIDEIITTSSDDVNAAANSEHFAREQEP